jgi:hypothetical protein
MLKSKLKVAVLWVVAPGSLVEFYRLFRGAYCLHRQGNDHGDTLRPNDGGSMYLRNVCKLVPDYTALQPRRQPSSHSLPREPQIIQE